MRKETLSLEKLLEADSQIVPAGSPPKSWRDRPSAVIPHSARLLLLLGLLLAVGGHSPADPLRTTSQRPLRSDLQTHRQPLHHLQSVPRSHLRTHLLLQDTTAVPQTVQKLS
jgi:hypothetical protein